MVHFSLVCPWRQTDSIFVLCEEWSASVTKEMCKFGIHGAGNVDYCREDQILPIGEMPKHSEISPRTTRLYVTNKWFRSKDYIPPTSIENALSIISAKHYAKYPISIQRNMHCSLAAEMFKNTKPGRWPYINFRLVINMEFELPTVCLVITVPLLDGILPKGPYPSCLRMADRALLTGYPRTQVNDAFNITERWTRYDLFRLPLKSSSLFHCEGIHHTKIIECTTRFSVVMASKPIYLWLSYTCKI